MNLKDDRRWREAIKRALQQPHWTRDLPTGEIWASIDDLTSDILWEIQASVKFGMVPKLKDNGEAS